VFGGLRSLGSVCVLAPCLLGMSACSAEGAVRGEACTRSAQCAAGLACIAGECSTDVDAVGRQNEVPMLMPEVSDGGADGGSDGAIDDASSADDDAG
jgi:hypothetical protein